MCNQGRSVLLNELHLLNILISTKRPYFPFYNMVNCCKKYKQTNKKKAQHSIFVDQGLIKTHYTSLQSQISTPKLCIYSTSFQKISLSSNLYHIWFYPSNIYQTRQNVISYVVTDQNSVMMFYYIHLYQIHTGHTIITPFDTVFKLQYLSTSINNVTFHPHNPMYFLQRNCTFFYFFQCSCLVHIWNTQTDVLPRPIFFTRRCC